MISLRNQGAKLLKELKVYIRAILVFYITAFRPTGYQIFQSRRSGFRSEGFQAEPVK